MFPQTSFPHPAVRKSALAAIVKTVSPHRASFRRPISWKFVAPGRSEVIPQTADRKPNSEILDLAA